MHRHVYDMIAHWRTESDMITTWRAAGPLMSLVYDINRRHVGEQDLLERWR
jgi:hypothetical protein